MPDNYEKSETADFSNLDDVTLIAAAEARIETALSQIILADKGVIDPWHAKAGIADELRQARVAIRALRRRMGPGREAGG